MKSRITIAHNLLSMFIWFHISTHMHELNLIRKVDWSSLEFAEVLVFGEVSVVSQRLGFEARWILQQSGIRPFSDKLSRDQGDLRSLW